MDYSAASAPLKPCWLGVPMDAGNSLPGTPHSGGFAPNQTEAALSDIQHRYGSGIARYLLANDPAARMLSGMMGDAMTGGGLSSRQWQQSDVGKAMTLGISALLNSSMIRNSRGSVLDLFAGVSNAAAGGGMTMDINGVRGMGINGRGAVTDNVSRLIYQSVLNSMWSPGGAGHWRRTQGFNMSQIGDIFSELGSRGAFRGLNVGAMTPYTSDDLNRMISSGGAAKAEALRIMAQGGGWKPMQLSESTQRTIQQAVENAARPLRTAKDIFGDRPIPELMRLGEQLSGAGFADPGGAGLIGSRLSQIKSLAAANNMTGESVARFDMATSSMLGALGHSTRTAAALSGSLVPESFAAYSGLQVKRRVAAEQGTFLADTSREELAGVKAAGMSRVLQEDPSIVAASLLKQHWGLSAGQNQALDALQDAYRQAPNAQARDLARANLRERIIQYSGLTDAHLVNRFGGDRGAIGAMDTLGQRELDMVTRTVSGSIDNRALGDAMLRFTDDVMSEKDFQDMGTDRTGFSGFMGEFFGKLGSGKQQEVLGALAKGDMTTVRNIIKDSEGFGTGEEGQKARDAFSAQLDKLAAGAGGAQRLGNRLSRVNSLRNADPTARGELSAEDQAVAARAARNAEANAASLGDGPSAGGFLESVARAMAGGTNLNDATVMDYGKLTKIGEFLEFRKTADGEGLITGDAGLANLKNLIPDLGKVLGITATGDAAVDDAAMQKALATGKGRDALHAFAKANQMGFSTTRDGNWVLGSKTDMEKASTALERDLQRRNLGVLFGQDPEKIGDAVLNDPAAQGKLIHAHMKDIMADMQKNPYGAMSDAWKDLAKTNPVLAQQGIEDHITDLKKNLAGAKGDKRKEIEGQIRYAESLKEDLKTAKDEYMGKLTVAIGDEVVMSLYKSRMGQ